jgi:hypothetical protein
MESSHGKSTNNVQFVVGRCGSCRGGQITRPYMAAYSQTPNKLLLLSLVIDLADDSDLETAC